MPPEALDVPGPELRSTGWPENRKLPICGSNPLSMTVKCRQRQEHALGDHAVRLTITQTTKGIDTRLLVSQSQLSGVGCTCPGSGKRHHFPHQALTQPRPPALNELSKQTRRQADVATFSISVDGRREIMHARREALVQAALEGARRRCHVVGTDRRDVGGVLLTILMMT